MIVPPRPPSDATTSSVELRRFLNLESTEHWPYWQQIGNRVAGPMAMGFAQWILDRVRTHEIDHVFFFARDGALPIEAFSRICDVPATYMFASRRMFQFAALDAFDDAARGFMTSTELGTPAIDYFTRLDLDFGPNLSTDLQARFGDVRTPVTSNQQLRQILEVFEIHQEMVLEAAARERRQLQGYFAEIGFSPGARKAIVDVGWMGSTQHALNAIIPDPDAVHGLYFALGRKAYPNDMNEAFAFLYDVPKHRRARVMKCMLFYELLLSAHHPSIVSVDSSRGVTEPVYAEVGPQEQQRLDIATDISAGCLHFLDAWTAPSGPNSIIGADLAISQADRVLSAPTPDDLAHVGSVPHAFGVGRVHYKNLVPAASLSPLLLLRILLQRTAAAEHAPYWPLGQVEQTRWLQRLPILKTPVTWLLDMAPKVHRATLSGPRVFSRKVREHLSL